MLSISNNLRVIAVMFIFANSVSADGSEWGGWYGPYSDVQPTAGVSLMGQERTFGDTIRKVCS